VHSFSQLRAMNREMALHVFDFELAPPVAVIAEVLEEQVFELRDFFLRQAIVPEVYRTRIQRLERLHAAAGALGLELSVPEQRVFETFFLPTGRMEDLLHTYAELINTIRLYMAQRLHPLEVGSAAEQLIDVQLAFEEQFDAHTAHITPLEVAVKAADAIDVGRLLHLLQHDLAGAEDLIARERQRIKARRARSHHR
jgi:hypothetical protein